MKRFKNIYLLAITVLSIVLAVYGGYRLAFRNLVFPHVVVAGVDTSGMDKTSVIKLLNSQFTANKANVVLEIDGKEIRKIDKLKVEYDFAWATDQAMGVGRNGNVLTQITEQINGLLKGRQIDVPISYDADELKDLIDQTVHDLNQEPVTPKLVIKDGKTLLVPGVDGVEIKTDKLAQAIALHLAIPGEHHIEIPLNKINTKENSELVDSAESAMNKWGDRSLRITFRNFQKSLDKETMLSLWGLTNERIDETNYQNLIEQIRGQVETEPKDAVFIFEDNKAKDFKPEIVGATIDLPSFKEKLANYLLAAEDKPLEIPVILTYPKIKTSDLNNMGINELVGSGQSTFLHSIPGRVFNVNLAASRINGTIVAPGEEFSFDNAVGDISKATGYQSAYVISGGRTVLGDGGGVCQVSTTVFRAALNTGLPITDRKAHAYRVGYYEQNSGPGIDATVFSPSVDLKFLNDTGHYLLIQTTVDTKSLSMKVDIYGTSDGRKATISTPKISSQTPPPSTIYTDDPTLPKGTLKQIDWSAWGAKVSFDYKVVNKDGVVTIDRTFFSNYQPWQAIYLRGTGG